MYLGRISDNLVYGDAYLFKLLVEGGLDYGCPPPKYVDLDLDFLFGLEEVSLSAILRSLLTRLAEQEEEAWMDLLIGPD